MTDPETSFSCPGLYFDRSGHVLNLRDWMVTSRCRLCANLRALRHIAMVGQPMSDLGNHFIAERLMIAYSYLDRS